MKKIVTFGEIMLRLSSPEHERLFQSPRLEASFGGGEANVAASLALFGIHAVFVTALSQNNIGQAAVRTLRGLGVDTSWIRYTKDRTGIYFLETGADQRPSLVIYDRADSSASNIKPGDFPWEEIFKDADWFHVSGITPALTADIAATCQEALEVASKMKVKISIDLNFRKKLWNYGVEAPMVMGRLAAIADILVANEEDIQLSLGIAPDPALDDPKRDIEFYRVLAAKTRERYPNLQIVAITIRESLSADRNYWSAVLDGRDGFRQSRKYALEDIVDRVGGGDSFAAGLIYGFLEYGDEVKALDFAVAASALKHTIMGDLNLVSRDEVERLMDGDEYGRVQR